MCQKKYDNARKHARRTFGQQVEPQECHYCGCLLYNKKKHIGVFVLPRLLKSNSDYILVYQNNTWTKYYLPSIEHLNPLAIGGMNSQNLVYACKPCNLQQSKPLSIAKNIISGQQTIIKCPLTKAEVAIVERYARVKLVLDPQTGYLRVKKCCSKP